MLEEQERKLTLIAESAERDYDKIMVRSKIIDAEMQRLNLIMEGRVVLEYDPRLKGMTYERAKIFDVSEGIEPSESGTHRRKTSRR